MKRVYHKPELFFENFSLTQSVAVNCGVPKTGNTLGFPTSGSRETCSWNNGGLIFWLDNDHNCVFHKGTDFIIDGSCYNNPNSANSIFGWS